MTVGGSLQSLSSPSARHGREVDQTILATEKVIAFPCLHFSLNAGISILGFSSSEGCRDAWTLTQAASKSAEAPFSSLSETKMV